MEVASRDAASVTRHIVPNTINIPLEGFHSSSSSFAPSPPLGSRSGGDSTGGGDTRSSSLHLESASLNPIACAALPVEKPQK